MAGAFEIVKGVTGVKKVSCRIDAVETVVEDAAVAPYVNGTALTLEVLFSCQ